jgi:hypothetical protein
LVSLDDLVPGRSLTGGGFAQELGGGRRGHRC